MTQPPLVLLWDDAYIDVQEARILATGRCTISDDRADFEHADAVVFPTPLMRRWLPEARAFPDQLWVQWSQESAIQFPSLVDEEFCSLYNLRMTYLLDSDVPIPYVVPDMFEQLPPLVPLARRHPVAVSAWVSSGFDRCGRDEYLASLMSAMPVHSYGRVCHNCDLANDVGPESKLAAIPQYRFTVAFENSMTTDYVTEKLFQPLLVGSVPIYRGAPNVATFAPAPHSYIDTTDFDGPEDLAQFLLAMTDDEYLQYHDWRFTGPTPEWCALFAPFATHSFVRLSQAIETIRFGRRAAQPDAQL